MSAVELALPRLKDEEGFSAQKYIDTEGRLTIGYGFCVDAGISKSAATALLIAQAQERHDELAKLAWYQALDPPRQSVCLDIAFNGGVAGLLRFTNMIDALTKRDWARAANECRVRNPELAGRYQALAEILRTGNA